MRVEVDEAVGVEPALVDFFCDSARYFLPSSVWLVGIYESYGIISNIVDDLESCQEAAWVLVLSTPELWTRLGRGRAQPLISMSNMRASLLQHLNWNHVQPQAFLEVVRTDPSLQCPCFRKGILNSRDGGANGLFGHYFDFYAFEDDEPIFDDWRELRTWLCRDLAVSDLVIDPDNPLLIRGMLDREYHDLHGDAVRICRINIFWSLEDLWKAGVDLMELGEWEKEAFNLGLWKERRLLTRDFHTGTYDIDGPKLIDFTYGSLPSDWTFTWDLEAEEFAGDFWLQIENEGVMPRLPGSWIEEEE